MAQILSTLMGIPGIDILNITIACFCLHDSISASSLSDGPKSGDSLS
jgi:hypothetical protein